MRLSQVEKLIIETSRFASEKALKFKVDFPSEEKPYLMKIGIKRAGEINNIISTFIETDGNGKCNWSGGRYTNKQKDGDLEIIDQYSEILAGHKKLQ